MKKISVVCPECKSTSDFDATALRLNPIKTVCCFNCSATFRPQASPKKKGNDNRKRSQVQERQAAKAYNARLQPGSGSFAGAKGDIRQKGLMRGECKLTRKRSFSLKLDELLKIEGEATGGELALFEVAFAGVYPNKKYVVLRAEDYAVICDGLGKV